MQYVSVSIEPDELVDGDQNDSSDYIRTDNFLRCPSQEIGHKCAAKPPRESLEFERTSSPSIEPTSPHWSSCPRRRTGSGRYQGPSTKQQLPPPSPAPSNASGLTNSRLTRRQIAIHVSSSSSQLQTQTSQHAFGNLLAAGDRPTLSGGGQRPTSPPNEIQHRTDDSDQQDSNEQEPADPYLTPSVVINQFHTSGDCIKSDSSSKPPKPLETPPTTPAIATQKSVHISSKTQIHTKPPPVPHPVPSKFDVNVDSLSPSELASESELQRELALLRYGVGYACTRTLQI